MRFSVRSLLLTISVVAGMFALAIPTYRYATIPDLYIGGSHHVRSNTIFPVVSMNSLSADGSERVRILFLYRRTKEPFDGVDWFPDWFEPHRTPDGTPIRGRPVNQAANAWANYPRTDSDLTVVYASDEQKPKAISVPYSKYAKLPKDDPTATWRELVGQTR